MNIRPHIGFYIHAMLTNYWIIPVPKNSCLLSCASSTIGIVLIYKYIEKESSLQKIFIIAIYIVSLLYPNEKEIRLMITIYFFEALTENYYC